MPAYVRAIHIDWHYDEASPQLRKILSEANERLSSRNHTWDTFREQLRELAVREPDVVADAFVEDGYRLYWLFRVRPVALKAGRSLRELGDARVEQVQISERVEDVTAGPVELPYDDALTVTLARDHELVGELGGDDNSIDVPLEYGDADEMRTMLERIANAMDDGGGRFVAEAGFDRFLVELAPGRAVTRRLVLGTEADLVARLRHAQYTAVPAPPRKPGEKYEQPLYWPDSMLQFLQEQATRTDRSLSNLVQLAFASTREAIAASNYGQLIAAKQSFGGDKRKQTLYFPGEMLDAMEALAARRDNSLSFVAQCAVALARDTMLAVPEAEARDGTP
ncbi:MAG: hypothetical protein AB7P03_13155 [Kofleriaceae bacterium]